MVIIRLDSVILFAGQGLVVDPVGELHHVGHDEETEAEAGDDHQHQDMLQTSPGSCSHVTKKWTGVFTWPLTSGRRITSLSTGKKLSAELEEIGTC